MTLMYQFLYREQELLVTILMDERDGSDIRIYGQIK